MARILTSTVGFLASYLVLMIPTYLLPYAGSNSSIVNGVTALMGRGPTPMWWTHFWCLFMLVLIGQVRGRLVGKPYLLVFPIVALVFDLTPGLSAIPLVPTLMHLLCLILGAMGAVSEATEFAEQPSFGNTGRVAAGISVFTVVGMMWFAVNTQQTAASTNSTQAPASAPIAEKSTGKAMVKQNIHASPTLDQPAKPVETAAAVRPAAKAKKPNEPRPPAPSEKAEKPAVRMINIRD